MKSRAAILVEQHQPLELDEIEVPSPGRGQVLVRVLCSGICGSQLGEIDGVKGPDRYLPHLLGHEGCGTVLECGSGVTTVSPGDRVVLHWRPGSGLEGSPPQYESAAHGKVNAGWVTTFNELALVSENRVTAVPQDFDLEDGALMGCAVTTAFGVVHNNARLRRGESILILGAGGIGLSMIQAAVLTGASPVIAVDIHDNRLELAAALGATHCINTKKTGLKDAVREIVGNAGVDVAVENTGRVELIEAAYELSAARGRTILVGVPPKGHKACIYTLPLHFGKVLTGSHGGEAEPDRDIPRYVDMVRKGLLDLKPLIGARYSLDQINEAIADMRSGAVAGRCMIHMEGGS